MGASSGVDLVHQVMLVIAVCALAAAAYRVAATMTPSLLERTVVAAPVAASAAVLEALVLGVFRVGSSPVALTLAAVATYVVSLLVFRSVEARFVSEVVARARAASVRDRVLMGAALGLGLAWVVANLRRPTISIDGNWYHLPEIVAWVHSGQPGAVLQVNYVFPVGSYPLFHEVLVAWGVSISRSLVPLAVAGPALLLTIAGAGWLALRRLRVPFAPALLAIVAVCSIPSVASSVSDGTLNDVPGLAWFACTAALCLALPARPALAPAALIAAGASAGTKSTSLVLTVVALAVALFVVRRHLWRLRIPLAAAGVTALAAGGFWYLRDFAQHGSPLWPHMTLPGGDPAPPSIDSFHSVLSAPSSIISGNASGYASFLAGALVLLAGGIAVAALARRRAVVAGSGAVALTALIWLGTPTAGASVWSAAPSQTRYLFPTLAVAAAVVALVARYGRRLQVLSVSLLASAIVWNVAELATGRFEGFVPFRYLAAGSLAGALAALASGRFRRLAEGDWRGSRAWRVSLAVLLAALVAVSLDAAGAGFVSREARGSSTYSGPLARWFAEHPQVSASHAPIAMAPALVGGLTGPSLQRRVELIGPTEPCAAVEARLADEWVVLSDSRALESLVHYVGGSCLHDRAHVTVGQFRIYPPAFAGGVNRTTSR